MVLVNPDEEPGHPAAQYLVQNNTLAFIMWGEDMFPVMVLDSRMLTDDEYTADHINAVMAHELGHLRMNTTSEPEADSAGAAILREMGHTGAAQLLEAR
tara:strand:+ start:114 stop:410 length:297 start_codon:yes stop_codon:yes gene_type:complete